MPKRRMTVATAMLLVAIVGLTIALVRAEVEIRRLRDEAVSTQVRTAGEKVIMKRKYESERRILMDHARKQPLSFADPGLSPTSPAVTPTLRWHQD